MYQAQQGVIKYLLIIAGILLVIIGIIGIFVPGLPTTIFLIGAAACFSRSSPKLHQWLLNHSWFGPVIYNWQTTRSIPKKAKVVALSMMLLAGVYTILILESLSMVIIINGLLLIPLWIVYHLPNSESLHDISDDKSKNSQ